MTKKHPQDNTVNDLVEQLAEIEHQRWADWQAWCHKILRENCPSPELEKVLERWDRQIATHYKDLTEQEKQSDREQVYRHLPLYTKRLEAMMEKKVLYIMGCSEHCPNHKDHREQAIPISILENEIKTIKEGK